MLGKSRAHVRDNQVVRNHIEESHDDPTGEGDQSLILEVINDVIEPNDCDKVHEADNYPRNILFLWFI